MNPEDSTEPYREGPANPDPFSPYEVISTERIYDSAWVGLRRDFLRLDDGARQEYHVVEIPDAVCVLPVRTDGRVVLIGQYRYPHGKTHWECPAGRLEPGEDPSAGALRELREETGYRAGSLRALPGFYPLNGISDHWVHLFHATDCELEGALRLDPSERLIVRDFSPGEARE
ncbi:MAG: NUDIX hydrolase, partial [Planctomycetota bacterium]